jgi:hypothetical protein
VSLRDHSAHFCKLLGQYGPLDQSQASTEQALRPIKDASTERTEGRNTALGRLLARTVSAKAQFNEDVQKIREQAQMDYGAILVRNQEVLIHRHFEAQ